jgi:hypothetical protein
MPAEGEHLGDLSGPIDQERAAFHAHVFLPVHGFLHPGFVGGGGIAGFVGGERKGQIVFLGEFLDRLHFVARDADDFDADLAELRQGFLERAGLLGASGGVGFGVEIQHERFALQARQADGASAAGRHFERRRLIAFR